MEQPIFLESSMEEARGLLHTAMLDGVKHLRTIKNADKRGAEQAFILECFAALESNQRLQASSPNNTQQQPQQPKTEY